MGCRPSVGFVFYISVVELSGALCPDRHLRALLSCKVPPVHIDTCEPAVFLLLKSPRGPRRLAQQQLTLSILLIFLSPDIIAWYRTIRTNPELFFITAIYIGLFHFRRSSSTLILMYYVVIIVIIMHMHMQMTFKSRNSIVLWISRNVKKKITMSTTDCQFLFKYTRLLYYVAL